MGSRYGINLDFDVVRGTRTKNLKLILHQAIVLTLKLPLGDCPVMLLSRNFSSFGALATPLEVSVAQIVLLVKRVDSPRA